MQRIKRMCLAALIVLASCQGEPSPEGSGSRMKVVFETPVSVGELDLALQEAGVQIDEFTFAQCDIRGGFRFQHGEDRTDGLARFQKLHQEFLNSAVSEARAEAASATSADAQRLEKFETLLRTTREAFELEELSLLDVTTTSEDGALLIQSRWAGQLVFVEDPPSQDSNSKGGVVYSNSHESWAPYAGTSKVTQGVTYQTFYFNNVSSFGSASTYEHETQVYNKAFADYAGYWSSNLPSAYYDTPFSDSIDNFTVGSAQASSIATYTQYYTYMSLSAGSSGTATVRIKGQLGHRAPSWCYSTWCIFADATTGSMTMFTAPIDGISWQY